MTSIGTGSPMRVNRTLFYLHEKHMAQIPPIKWLELKWQLAFGGFYDPLPTLPFCFLGTVRCMFLCTSFSLLLMSLGCTVFCVFFSWFFTFSLATILLSMIIQARS